MTICTITRAGRCDEYGRPLVPGQLYDGTIDAVEALVRSGFATTTDPLIDGGYPANVLTGTPTQATGRAGQLVTAAIDPSGAITGLVRPDGGVQRLPAGIVPAPAISALATADFQFGGQTQPRALNLPNPYPSRNNVPVHPSVLHFAEGWNGYRWWLAYTPYPDSDSDVENPCVTASNDLVTWVDPAPNPLAPKPAPPTAYNADTHLFMAPDNSRMYLAYRERGVGGQNVLFIMDTADGRTWSAPRSVLSGAVGSVDFASPSIWWNGTGWTMLSHNVDAGSMGSWILQRRVSTSADIYAGFGTPTTVTPTRPSGRDWWHSWWGRLASGQVVGLMHDATTGGGAGLLRFFSSADDGVTLIEQNPFPTGVNWYRSTMCVRGDVLDVFVSSLQGSSFPGTWHIEMRQGRLAARRNWRDSMQRALAVSAADPLVLLADTFNRADSASTLGTALTGQTYSTSSTWGIASNRAYPVASGRALASVGVADHEVHCRLTDITASGQAWVIARAVDQSNYLRAGMIAQTAGPLQAVRFQAIVGGAVQDEVIVAAVAQRGDYIGLRCVGTNVAVLVNGEVVFSTSSGRFVTTGTSVGMQANAGASTFLDDLVALSV